jgi:hypothetical protein
MSRRGEGVSGAYRAEHDKVQLGEFLNRLTCRETLISQK